MQKLIANPRALGVFGYSFLDQNRGSLQGSLVEGVAPEFETIASGQYPIARAMYVYVKKAHVDVIPGLREFIGEYTSDKALGDEGYLADKGLVAAPAAERAATRRDALALGTLKSL